jgi:hypothetical protein
MKQMTMQKDLFEPSGEEFYITSIEENDDD